MKQYRGSRQIARPPEEVFGFLADFSNDPAWRHDVGASELVSGVAGERGARFRQSGPNPAKPQTYHIDTTAVDRGAGSVSFATVDASPVAVKGTYRVGAAPGGSEVTMDIELHPAGVVKLFQPFMGGALRKTTERYLADLKGHLESSMAGGPPS